jgi:hypothetical protein
MDIEQIDNELNRAIDIACDVSALLSTTADACENNDLEQEIPLRIAYEKQDELIDILYTTSSKVLVKKLS